MTNTIAFRVTAVCTFCARRFDATAIPCEDIGERLCCPDCVCDYCGHGHATETDSALCEGDSRYPAGELSDFDYDAWTDSIRHTLTER